MSNSANVTQGQTLVTYKTTFLIKYNKMLYLIFLQNKRDISSKRINGKIDSNINLKPSHRMIK